MKKLLACDIDGTILHLKEDAGVHGYTISQEDLDAVEKFRKQGHFFTLCTGRTLQGVRAVLDMFPLEIDGAILSGGALFHKALQSRPLVTLPLASFPIPSGLACEIISYFYDTKDYILYWSDGQSDFAFSDRTIHWMEENQPRYITLEEWMRSPLDIANIGITAYSGEESRIGRAVQEIEKRWAGLLECHCNRQSLDVCFKGVNKGSGIARMQKLLGEAYVCYAVGDAYNDLPMFLKAGKDHAYLLAGGEQALSGHVKKSVRSVAECIFDILEG